MSKKTNIFILLIVVILIPNLVLAAGNAEKGKEIYNKRCWWCHGEKGAGDGPGAEFLNPPPRDFTAGVYKWKSTPFDEIVPSEQDFIRMIKGGNNHNAIAGWTGMNGTSMPGWADMLSDQDTADLVAYIKGFAGLKDPEKPPINLSGAIKASTKSIENGKRLFKERCSECHGEDGKGDGTKKLKDDWGARTWPRNFTKAWTFRVSNDPKDIYTRITVGIPGTQMPSFADPRSEKKLTDEERWDVANYVNSLNTPYKKPGDKTVIAAVRIEGDVPDGVDDPRWKKAEYTSFYLVPQLIADERHFRTSLDSISVKVLYNKNEIAMLIEWDDRTRSLPRDIKAMEIADGEVFEDAIAVQWPIHIVQEGEKSYFGMGDARWPVNIWYWKSESGVAAPQTVKLFNSKGIKEREERDPGKVGLRVKGVYNKGTWRVVIRRLLKTGDADKDVQFAEGRFIPIAFAVWDGSKGEKGSKHMMTTWYWLYMQPVTGIGVYAWPAVVGIIIFGAEIFWLRSSRKKVIPKK